MPKQEVVGKNYLDGDSHNFAWVSHIPGNSSCHPAPCTNYWNTIVYKKLMPKCAYKCAPIASHRPRNYVEACVYP